jgi:putative restriction endonuclease
VATVSEFSRDARTSAMTWLDHRRVDWVTYADLARFEYEGHPLPLMDPQRGIRKPRGMDSALSIRTVFTAPNAMPPYADEAGSDGLTRYKYRGSDPQHPENRALRQAFQDRLPLIWFFGVAPGEYLPIYPVWIVADEPEQLQFVLALDEGQRLIEPGHALNEDSRRYIERLSKARLHQPVFRARVLAAYQSRCAICSLRHSELLDAAHILPDGHPRGLPIVPNGVAMCKIHHAAYDSNIVGIRPDLVVEVRSDILAEIDGPMLRHGLQELEGWRLHVPAARRARPDSDGLEERYETFRTLSA